MIFPFIKILFSSELAKYEFQGAVVEAGKGMEMVMVTWTRVVTMKIDKDLLESYCRK